MIWTYFIIFLLAAIPFFEVLLIVPVAIIGGIPAIPVIIIAFLGNLLTIILLIVFVDSVRNWRKKKKGNKEKSESKNKRAKNIWDKYGLPGLAFIGPFFVGSHLTALLAISFGGTRTKTLVLMTFSIAIWAILLGSAAYLGFDSLVKDEEGFGFITRLLDLNK
ncbi:small multi-drug export protein [Cytobacillus sp. IB215665]|uniref:small multi-drug export protein n=1 Tax=Cytobacillus sp. IB215665 TaxID=3097357 RepID=UPI002A0F07CD|nr:small multi-drug export protein [Cytobacillus sp. IB215665]MDX8363927.1 small multi-drug export protein [Cytobacillus sp. IB215665]